MLGVFSCDPGGAEILSTWLSNYKRDYIVCLKGPAILIFKKKIKNLKNFNFDYVINSCDKIITSTGWSSKHEINAIIEAKKKKKYLITILDHWTNYRERFVKNKKLYLPNEVWVVDKKAFSLAQKYLNKNVKIKKKNFYFNKLIKKINFLKEKNINKNNILYLSTPNISNKKPDIFFFKVFIKNLHLFRKKNQKIIFRLHKLDNIKKYLDYIKIIDQEFDIEISKNSLEYDLARCCSVFGSNSAAQAISVMAQIRTINIHPKFLPRKNDISRVFNKIENFFQLIKKK